MKKLTELELMTILRKALLGDKAAVKKVHQLMESPYIKRKLRQLK